MSWAGGVGKSRKADRLEDTVQISDDFYRSVFEFANDAIIVESLDGRILQANRRACEMLHYTKDELLQMLMSDILAPNWRGREKEIRDALRRRGSLVLEASHVRKDGKVIDVEVSMRFVTRESQEVILTFVRDVSARRRAEMSNAELARMGRLLSSARSIASAARIIADAADELIGWRVCSVDLREGRSERLQTVLLLQATEEGPKPLRFRRGGRELSPLMRGVLQHGRVLLQKKIDRLEKFAPDVAKMLPADIASLLFVPIRVGSDVTGVIWLGRDKNAPPYREYDLEALQVLADYGGGALERIRAEEQLANEKERLAVTLESIGDGVIATDTEGRIVLMNAVAEKLTGWRSADAFGKPVGEVFSIIDERTRQPCGDLVQRVIHFGGDKLPRQAILAAKDGVERIVTSSGAPIRDTRGRVIGVVIVFRDVTEKRRLEEDLRRIDKLEAIGVLAGGIAHDFNNILTVVLGNVSIARMMELPEEVDEYLSLAEEGCHRAKKLTDRLLTFARGGAPVKQAAAVRDLIEETVAFALAGSSVSCEIHVPDDVWPVDVDVGQINQVIQNLVINAKQAMNDHGKIEIQARNCSPDMAHFLPKEHRYVCISVKDHGPGVPMENLRRIFDPYFTTKETGKGLGLAICYSIVRNHGGHIAVESEPGKGATFFVYLPASSEAVKKKARDDASTTPAAGRVLVMDDERAILTLAKNILESGGYDVECAADGADALRLFIESREAGSPFDVVVLDLTVPGGLGGLDTLRRMEQVDPSVRAIVVSGYSSDEILADCERYGFKAAIQKPFVPSVLLRVVGDVISGATA